MRFFHTRPSNTTGGEGQRTPNLIRQSVVGWKRLFSTILGFVAGIFQPRTTNRMQEEYLGRFPTQQTEPAEEYIPLWEIPLQRKRLQRQDLWQSWSSSQMAGEHPPATTPPSSDQPPASRLVSTHASTSQKQYPLPGSSIGIPTTQEPLEAFPVVSVLEEEATPTSMIYTLKLEQPSDLTTALDLLRGRSSIIFLDISEFRKNPERLKAMVKKLKHTQHAVRGDLVGIDESWLCATSSGIQVERGGFQKKPL